MHSEIGPVRQNPIQRTVRTAHLSVLMTAFHYQYHTGPFHAVMVLYPHEHPPRSGEFRSGLHWLSSRWQHRQLRLLSGR